MLRVMVPVAVAHELASQDLGHRVVDQEASFAYKKGKVDKQTGKKQPASDRGFTSHGTAEMMVCPMMPVNSPTQLPASKESLDAIPPTPKPSFEYVGEIMPILPSPIMSLSYK